jgi:hypothetical protein
VEANPEEIKSVAQHQEVLKEEAAVKAIGILEDRHEDMHLAVRRHQQPKERIQDDGGPARSCRPPVGGWPKVTFLHGIRDAVIKVRRYRRQEGRNRNAITASETEV